MKTVAGFFACRNRNPFEFILVACPGRSGVRMRRVVAPHRTFMELVGKGAVRGPLLASLHSFATRLNLNHQTLIFMALNFATQPSCFILRSFLPTTIALLSYA